MGLSFSIVDVAVKIGALTRMSKLVARTYGFVGKVFLREFDVGQSELRFALRFVPIGRFENKEQTHIGTDGDGEGDGLRSTVSLIVFNPCAGSSNPSA